MSEYVPALFAQGAFYLPSLLVHLLCLVLAAALFVRDRVAASLLAGGTMAQMLASLVAFGSTAYALTATERGLTMAQVSMTTGAMSLGGSLLRCLGDVLIAVAVGAAVMRREPTP